MLFFLKARSASLTHLFSLSFSSTDEMNLLMSSVVHGKIKSGFA